MPGGIGLPELVIVLAIILLIFGANRVAPLGRELGASIKAFRSGLKDDKSEEVKEEEV